MKEFKVLNDQAKYKQRDLPSSDNGKLRGERIQKSSDINLGKHLID
jgi:hypothetical protein